MKYNQPLGITNPDAPYIDGDPFALAVVSFVAERDSWCGTAGDLAEALTPDKPTRGWPTTGPLVRGRLKRLVPALAVQGLTVRFPAARTRRGRMIEIENTRAEQSQLSQQSHCPMAADEYRLAAGDTLCECPFPAGETVTPTVTRDASEDPGKTAHGDCCDCCGCWRCCGVRAPGLYGMPRVP
jgi:hypothetical protein